MYQEHRIVPLWERMPATFGYGLRTDPLSVAIGLGILSLLLLEFVGLWGQLLVLGIMIKYGFAALLRTANGELDPPPLDWDSMIDGYELPVKYVAIIILFVLMLISVAMKFGETPVNIAMFLGTVLLPAMTMVLAQTNSLLAAINPVLLTAMAARIGWTYLVLLLFFMLLSQGQGYMTEWVVSVDYPYLMVFGFNVVTVYFTIVSYHMMGYVLLQSHERLGEELPAGLQREPEDQRMDVFDGFVAEGQTDAAIAELDVLLRETPRDIGLHRRMHNLLLSSQKAEALASHTRRALPFMLDGEHADMAAGFYLDCVGMDQVCHPRRAGSFAPLAVALRHRGESRQAAMLVNAFNKEFAKDEPSRPDFYLEVARILAEDLNQDAQAQRLLQMVAQLYPDHERTGEINAYLQTLKSISAG